MEKLKKIFADKLPVVGGLFGIFFLTWPWIDVKETVLFAAGKEEGLALFAAFLLMVGMVRKNGLFFFERIKSLDRIFTITLILFFVILIWNAFSTFVLSCHEFSSLMWFYFILKASVVFTAVFLSLSGKKLLNGFLNAFVLNGAIVGFICNFMRIANSLNKEYFSEFSRFAADRTAYPFGMPAGLGIFEVLASLAAIVFIFECREQKQYKKLLFYLVGLIFCVAGIFASSTLSSSAGMLAGVWAFVLLKIKDKRTYLLATAIIIVATIIYSGYFFSTTAGKNIIYNSSWGLRIVGCEISAKLFLEKPLFGWGVNTLHHAYPYVEGWRAYLHGAKGAYYVSSHCEPFQILAELGVAGFLLYAAFFVCILYGLFRKTQQENGLVKTSATICFSMLAAIICDSLFSPVYRHGEMFFLAHIVIAMGVCCGVGETKLCEFNSQICKKRIWGLGGFGVLVFLGTAYLAITSVLGNIWLQKAYRASRKKDNYLLQLYSARAEQNLQEIDLWKRARGLHAEYYRRTGNYDTAIKMNLETLATATASTSISRAIIGMEKHKGRLAPQLIMVLYYLEFRPYSVEFRGYLYSVLRLFEKNHLTMLRELKNDERLSSFDRSVLEKLSDEDWRYLEIMCDYVHGVRTDDVVAELQKLSGAKVNIVPIKSELGRVLVRSGRNGDAIAILDPECRDIPSDPSALYHLALAYKNKANPDDFGKAFSLLYRALQRYPEYADASVLYGAFCMADNRYSEAIITLRNAARLNPRVLLLRLKLIGTMITSKKYNEASEELNRAKKYFPENEKLLELEKIINSGKNQ